MPSRTKKSPSDYPLYSFRLTETQKEELNDLVEDVRDSLNKRLNDDEKLWMKNDVIFRALMLGLPILKKHPGKSYG